MTAKTLLVVFGVTVLVASYMNPVLASDPDLTTDYAINATKGADFQYTGLRNPQPAAPGTTSVNFASFVQFPGLTGFGLTAVLFQFGSLSQVGPHSHPRATELFYVLTGTIEVGFVDTTNTLFETTLYAGDLFIFPKGLVHFQRNNQKETASGYSVLGSGNPGLQFTVEALLKSSGTGLPDNVLASAFATSVPTVQALKKAAITPPSGR